MSSKIDRARESGYSDEDILDYLSKVDKSILPKIQKAKSSGYEPSQILEYIQESKKPSKIRSIISAPIKGIVKGIQGFNPLGSSGPVPYELGAKLLDQVLPTRPEHDFLERAGKLAPQAALGAGSVPSAILQTAGGTIAGELAKKYGAGEKGQGLAELAGMIGPQAIKNVAQKGISSLKAALTGPVETLKSGLNKPRALESKKPSFGIITPERQEKSISQLNKQASQITKESLHKHLPISKQIEQGVNFESQFEKDFGNLKKIASSANPDINIHPLSKFLRESSSKFKGIPEPHAEAKKIISESLKFRRNPENSLENLLKIYRSNNQKIKNSYETSRVTGKQEEYVDFLLDMNRKITESIEKTLPTDSAWVKRFKDLNKGYREYRSALKTSEQLKPILGESPTPANLKKIAEDPKLKTKLELSMGKEGASEIIQVAKDLKMATESVKNIKAKELKVLDNIFPLGVFLPLVKIPSALYGAKKALDWARRGYGFFLSTPARRKAYSQAAKALSENNVKAYSQATSILKKELENSED